MEVTRRLVKASLASLAFAACAVGASTLLTPRAEAMPIIFLCGTTMQYECTAPGQEPIVFGGTLCEVRIFERRTGYSCTPF